MAFAHLGEVGGQGFDLGDRSLEAAGEVVILPLGEGCHAEGEQ